MSALHGNSRPPARHRKAASPAFTLLESLASMAVLAFLLILLTQLFSGVSQSWLRGGADAYQRSNARALADFITEELQEALLPVDTQSAVTTGAASGGNLRFVVNPPTTQLPISYRNADAVFWQAPIATEASFGDIAQLGYFVTWSNGVPSLCRLFINPSVKEAGVVGPNTYFKVYDGDPDAWLNTGILNHYIEPSNRAAGYPGLFSEYVLGFWVECFAADGTELPRDFDSLDGYSATWQGMDLIRRLPDSVRISIAQSDSGHAHFIGESENEIRAITGDANVRNAAAFLVKMQNRADSSPTLAKVLPSIRIHTIKVKLLNAR